MKIKLIFLAATTGLLVACGGGTTEVNDDSSANKADSVAQQPGNGAQVIGQKIERTGFKEVKFESLNGAELAEILGFYVEGKDRTDYQGYYSEGKNKEGETVPNGPFKFTSIVDDGKGNSRKLDYKGDFETGKRNSQWIYRVRDIKENETQQEFSILITYAMDTCVSSSIKGIIHPEMDSMAEEFRGEDACDFETIYSKINSQWGSKIEQAADRKKRKAGE